MTKIEKLPKGIIGYGTMRTTWTPNPVSEKEAVEIYYTAYKAGARFFNGGEFYGENWINLKYLNAFVKAHPEIADEIIISIKGGADMQTFEPTCTKEGIKRSVEDCLRHLSKIDVFECARVDTSVPIEETMQYLQEYVASGKIGGISLSEASSDHIRRAAKVVPVAFMEVEFSLCTTDILSNGIASTCAELGIPVVCYSPLGLGFLAGTVKKPEDIPEGDFRRHFDRFQQENLALNNKFVDKISAIGKEAGLTPAQLSLAWIRFFNSDKNPNKAKYPEFVPLPGSSNPARIKENCEIREISLSTFEKVQKVVAEHAIAGARYNEQLRGSLFF